MRPGDVYLAQTGDKGSQEMIDITELLIGIFGDDAQPESVRPISGGDINEAYLICLKNGRRVFLKENTLKNAGFFEAEKEGLSAIRETGAIHVPTVLCAGTASPQGRLLGTLWKTACSLAPGACREVDEWREIRVRFG